MAVKPGVVAPQFSLPPAPGPERVSLADYRGERNVVLLFFPLAYSSVCTDEMCRMVERLEGWGELNAQVLGISVDSPFVAQKFRQDTGADFPFLSDFNKMAIHAYDVANEDFFGLHGVAKRSAFVIDKQGVIRYAWVTEDADQLPDFDTLKAEVDKLD